jgi:uncharacterized membrane protein
VDVLFSFADKEKSTKKETAGCVLLLCPVPAVAGVVVAAKAQCR